MAGNYRGALMDFMELRGAEAPSALLWIRHWM